MRGPPAPTSGKRRPVAARVACAVWLGCALGLGGSDARAELIIGTAASLRAPMLEIAERFEASFPGDDVVVSFGASSALAQQIRAGAPIDVFASADSQISARLVEQGFLLGDRTVSIARNRLVVIRAENLGFPVERAADLARPELRRIALPEFAVPVGRYAREWLRGRGLLVKLATRTVQTDHAIATLRAVDAGFADAAVVYTTDARLAKSAEVAFEIPATEQPAILYVATPVHGSKNLEAAARFVRFLRTPTAVGTFARAGFDSVSNSAEQAEAK